MSKIQTTDEVQNRLIGSCEGCEAVFEYGNKPLLPIDTLPDFKDSGTRLKVSGTIYLADGKTPAQDVILYVYHTNQEGIYPKRGGEKGWAKQHGYIRGWIKTGKDGKYTFYTLKPGIYPDRGAAAHIHPVILKPDGKYYWLEDYYFEGDTLLTERELRPKSPRGGNGNILKLRHTKNLWVITRDIILGKNIAGYK